MQNIIDFLQNYFIVGQLVIVASVLALILFTRLLILWIATKKGTDYPERNQAIRYFLNWITFYCILLFLFFYFGETSWMLKSFYQLGSTNITLSLFLIIFLILSFAYQISKVLTSLFMPRIYDRYQLDRGIQFTFNRVSHYMIMIIAVMISISTVGINLSALTVFASVLGVGIGFGLQNITSNFISGIILLFERPIKVGDRVIVNDIIGDIEQINMRATIIKSIDNEHIIVPNSYFLEEHVINRSYSDPTMRLVIPIGVAYGSDPELVRDLLIQVANDESSSTESVLLDPLPFVYFTGFGDSSLDFELFIWISNPNDIVRVKTNVNFRIHHILKAHQIEIPFPQRDLHLRSVDSTIYEKWHQ
ncbi:MULTISPECIES: mechanosensitive ion channel family protein [Paraliobacillus]|uniref:mechanosensitive ion channel family protein n=1 Tax=Paraliobacillus TaxID=200903 RepID=UPI001E63D764|nr:MULTISPECIES: mechanosensitive ion channel domain-containing protein [Paraliobacillus]